jgi:hypothetical protein
VIDEAHAGQEATMNDQRDVEERDRRFAGQDTREELLAELPVEERRLELAGVPSAVLEDGPMGTSNSRPDRNASGGRT